MDYRGTDSGPFCNKPEDIRHILLQCQRLHQLSLQLMTILLYRFIGDSSIMTV